MLLEAATPEMVKEWKSIYTAYRDKLHPNRKSAQEIITYLLDKYPTREIRDEKWKCIVTDNVLLNEHLSEKLPVGASPKATVFEIQNSGSAIVLYAEQDEVFQGQPIIIGVELETGYFQVEGSSYLWDELFAFRGLDAADLDNFYLVAEYITCLRKFNLLDDTVK